MIWRLKEKWARRRDRNLRTSTIWCSWRQAQRQATTLRMPSSNRHSSSMRTSRLDSMIWELRTSASSRETHSRHHSTIRLSKSNQTTSWTISSSKSKKRAAAAESDLRQKFEIHLIIIWIDSISSKHINEAHAREFRLQFNWDELKHSSFYNKQKSIFMIWNRDSQNWVDIG